MLFVSGFPLYSLKIHTRTHKTNKQNTEKKKLFLCTDYETVILRLCSTLFIKKKCTERNKSHIIRNKNCQKDTLTSLPTLKNDITKPIIEVNGCSLFTLYMFQIFYIFILFLFEELSNKSRTFFYSKSPTNKNYIISN